jgi:transposase
VKKKRRDYIDAVEEIDPNDLIFLDESGSNLGMTSDYARVEGGQRAKMPKPFDAGERFSIIGAICLTGIVAMMYITTTVNGEIFKTYVERLLLPKLHRGQFVIFDNINFHKSRDLIKLIESSGAKVVFLPPYSPDLSPIEKMWSKIKEILKRMKPRSKAEFHKALVEAITAVNDGDFEEWYESCGYSVAA